MDQQHLAEVVGELGGGDAAAHHGLLKRPGLGVSMINVGGIAQPLADGGEAAELGTGMWKVEIVGTESAGEIGDGEIVEAIPEVAIGGAIPAIPGAVNVGVVMLRPRLSGLRRPRLRCRCPATPGP